MRGIRLRERQVSEARSVAQSLPSHLAERAAEAKIAAKAQRRYKGRSVEDMLDVLREQLAAVDALGRRLLDRAADVGIALEALRDACRGRGRETGYLAALEQLGISQSSADRMRKLAVYRELLPAKPPPGLFGSVWTDRAALEFGRTMVEMEDDVPEGGDLVEAAATRLRVRRRAAKPTGITAKLAKLEIELSTALHSGDAGSMQALDYWLAAGRRLDAVASDLSKA